MHGADPVHQGVRDYRLGAHRAEPAHRHRLRLTHIQRRHALSIPHLRPGLEPNPVHNVAGST